MLDVEQLVIATIIEAVVNRFADNELVILFASAQLALWQEHFLLVILWVL